jgi:NOL1/NOP2/fmu family ribosome biogenesis protein
MRNLRIMNARESKRMLDELSSRFDIDIKLLSGCSFMEDNGEIWVIRSSCLTHGFQGLSVESAGLLFARKKPALELTVNALQLFCCKTEKNAISLDRADAAGFIKGSRIGVQKPDGTYVVKYLKNPLDLGVVRENKLARKKQKP